MSLINLLAHVVRATWLFALCLCSSGRCMHGSCANLICAAYVYGSDQGKLRISEIVACVSPGRKHMRCQ